MLRLNISLVHHHHHHADSMLEHNNHNLVDNLLMHNSSLTRHLSKYRKQYQVQTQPTIRNQQQSQAPSFNKDYPKSIVQQRKLQPILVPEIQTDIFQKQIPGKAGNKSKNKEPISIDKEVQTDRIASKKNKKPQESNYGISDSISPQMKAYLKDKAKQSRYLPDSAFKKYFNKECFHDYGRQNTNGQADGFIYGSYLKTHSINPHSGLNHPFTYQTNKNALNSGKPGNYDPINTVASANPFDKNDTYRMKQQCQPQQIRKNAQNHKKMEQKYKSLKLAPKYEDKNVQKDDSENEQYFQGKQRPQIEKKNQQSHLLSNPRKQSLRRQPLIQTHKKKVSFDETIKPKSISKPIIEKQKSYPISNVKTPQQQYFPYNQKASLSPQPYQEYFAYPEHQCQIPISPRVQKICESKRVCRYDHGSHTCKCCLDSVKQQIMHQASKNKDLADRILTSSKKSTMYKNYSLNRYPNLALNPKNYRQCCGLININP